MDLKKTLKSFFKNKTIINIVIVGLLTLALKIVGFYKEIIIADNFGLSELIDTFLIAYLIPGFISGVFINSLRSVFIPNYVSELKTGKNIGAFQSTSFLVIFGISLFFCLISFLFTDVYLETFFAGHTPEYYSLVKLQFYYVMPCIIVWGFSSLLSGLLNIDNEFTLSSISGIFIPISIIVCLFFFKEYLGTIVLAFGTLIGSIISFIFLTIVAINRNIISLHKPDFYSVNVKILFLQLPAKISSSLLTGLNKVVDQFFAAKLIVGSIAALNYGVKIPMFAIGLATIPIGNVLLPYFSKKTIDNKRKSFIELKKMLKYLLIGSIVVTVLLIILSKPIIHLIFERNAFTSSDTIVVSKIQQMYLLQIPFYLVGITMVKFLTSINKNAFMAYAALITVILNFLLNYILIDIIGVYGLALATSLVSFINSLILYIYINYISKTYV